MIIKEFNYGWGPEYPIVAKEQEILLTYIRSLIDSHERVVIVNSTWYGAKQHEQTMSWLHHNHWDRLVLVSMLDPPLVAAQPQMDRRSFNEFERPVHAVGSFPSGDEIVFWAIIAQDYLEPETGFYPDMIDRPWISYNRKPHLHRRQLFRDLRRHDLLEAGIVSFGAAESQNVIAVSNDVGGNDLAPNGHTDHFGLPNDIASLGNLDNWRRCFLNVVTESCFRVTANWFVSEKIFKPIIGLKPFVVLADDGAVTWLTQHGFQHYCNDFEDITDVDVSDPYNVIVMLQAVNAAGPKYWRKKYIELQPKMLYNQNQFWILVQQQRDKIEKGIQIPNGS